MSNSTNFDVFYVISYVNILIVSFNKLMLPIIKSHSLILFFVSFINELCHEILKKQLV